jgi:bifunctional DNA-binding transcriptional regulator/antitoxin component of YhaV-PrlF toxin-antitoxin module
MTETKKNTKPKLTFMLHEPETFVCVGKYASTDWSYAALKAASRGFEKILLRKTNSKEVREFLGKVVELDIPQEVKRGDRVIMYNRKPVVKYVQKFYYTGPEINDSNTNCIPTNVKASDVEVRV